MTFREESQRIHDCTVELHAIHAEKTTSQTEERFREVNCPLVTNLDFQVIVWEELLQEWDYTHSVVVYLCGQPREVVWEYTLHYITSVQPTDGSSGPLVIPLSVMRTGFLAKGARSRRGSRKYPIDRCWLQSWSSVPPSNRPG